MKISKVMMNWKVMTMRKLALSDDILLQIEKPARYIGGEVNSVMKDGIWYETDYG